MDWEQMRDQLEVILDAPLTIATMPAEEWERLAAAGHAQAGTAGHSVLQDNSVSFFLHRNGGQVTVLQISEVLLTVSERKLVELAIEARRSAPERKPAAASLSDEEKRVAALREWLLLKSEQGITEAELPDTFVSQLSMYATRIPLLLYGEFTQTRRVQYQELKKLLESFFGGDILLIPLMDKEWLILGSESLLNGGEEREDGEEESLEESLYALVSGLHAMLESEWVGECHLAVDLPIKPAHNLLGSLHRLRETLMLGRMFHVSSNIHLPWMLRLEKLLHLLPERDRTKFLEQVLKGADHVLDAETQTTLEQFFALDCNVSETAKKLYVHRNTLLYRLDKFKNETGLDVRTFSDAVLVRIALLLYKVTKRK
jgi:hypothetical protein